jgi:hypothetical protein
MRTVFITHTSFYRAAHSDLVSRLLRERSLGAPAASQSGRLEIEYTVKVADIPGQFFHVTTDIRNINQPALELSLPVWSPGW